MSSLDIAPLPEDAAGPRSAGHREAAPVSDVFPTGEESHLLEIGIQAIQLSPCHAGPPAPRSIRLDTTAGFLACSCPLYLSAPGKPVDPEIFLQSLPAEQGICQGASWRRLGRPRGEVPAVQALFRVAPRRTPRASFEARGSPVIYAAAAVGCAEDTKYRFGVLHFAYLPVLRCPNHLCPFALQTALPLPWQVVTPATTTGTVSP